MKVLKTSLNGPRGGRGSRVNLKNAALLKGESGPALPQSGNLPLGNVRRSKLKHIDARQQWVEWLRNKELANLTHVDTTLNIADFFTKILDQETFCRLRAMMMVDRPIDATLRASL